MGNDDFGKIQIAPLVTVAGDVENLGLGQVIWLQDGVESNEGKILAQKSGVKFVSNDCILRRHRSL